MDYIITCSSTADLPQEYVAKHRIPYIPYNYVLDGKEYLDDLGASLDTKVFYDTMRAGAPASTSQVNASRYTAFFEPFLQQGQNVLHIELSSGITGTIGSANLAAEDLRARYPERKILLVDSLCACMGFGLLVHYAAALRDEGKSLEEVHQWAEENKTRINHWFTVDDLMHLKRGGRVSGAAAFVGTMLQIKPVLHVDNLGRLVPVEKCRGRKNALSELVSKMEEHVDHPDGQDVFISHADAPEDAQHVAQMVRQKFPGIRSLMIGMIGPVIGAHAGPGTVSLFFLGKSR